MCAATRCLGNVKCPSHIFAQRAWLCSGGNRLAGPSSWTINVPTVDEYLKRPPDNMVGELQEVLCEVGSRVHVDEEVAVIETDKVAVSVYAQREGVISAILVMPGDEVKENQPLYVAHNASMDTGSLSRRWAREESRRKASKEKEEEVERDRILKMWRQRMDKQRQARRNFHGSSKDRWQRRGGSNAGQHRHAQLSHGALATLGLKPGASKRAIKVAFRKMAMQYHPDRNSDLALAEKFKAARAAYDTLMRS